MPKSPASIPQGDAGYPDDDGRARPWLRAHWQEARALQPPLPDGTLEIVATGKKEDPALAA
jgi:hypothetical protein